MNENKESLSSGLFFIGTYPTLRHTVYGSINTISLPMFSG